tara:strand:+ start:159 stop:1313 length:1155 start_codon:yes stop_codon:yes gene_type:complete
MGYLKFLFGEKLLFGSLIGLMISCNHKNLEKNEASIQAFELSEIEKIQKDELEVFDLIALETTSENLMGTDVRIRSSKDYFFVFDEAIQDGVHQFQKNGEYMGRRAIVGEGPNTINRLNDFFVGEDGTLEVLSSNGDQAQVYSVGEDNSIKLILKVDYYPSSFTKLPNGEYLFYGSYNLPYVSHRMIRTDSTGIVLEKYLENEYTNKMLPMSERNFFYSGSSLYVVESFNKNIYQFQNNLIEPIVEIDFGNYAIPSKFWELNLLEGGFDLLQQNGFAFYNGYFKNQEYSLVSIHIQKPAGIFKNIIFTNELTGNQRVLETSLSDDYLFHYPFGIEGDEFLFFTYDSEIKKEKGLSLRAELLDKIPNAEFDYPVLMKVKINKDDN